DRSEYYPEWHSRRVVHDATPEFLKYIQPSIYFERPRNCKRPHCWPGAGILRRAAPSLLISSANSRSHCTAVFPRRWLLPLFVPSYSTQMWGRGGGWLVFFGLVA